MKEGWSCQYEFCNSKMRRGKFYCEIKRLVIKVKKLYIYSIMNFHYVHLGVFDILTIHLLCKTRWAFHRGGMVVDP